MSLHSNLIVEIRDGGLQAYHNLYFTIDMITITYPDLSYTITLLNLALHTLQFR